MTKKQRKAQDTLFKIILLMNKTRVIKDYWAVGFLKKLKIIMEKY